MRVENKEAIKKETKQEINLFKRFGTGVHLIRNMKSKKEELMLIALDEKAHVLFIEKDNSVDWLEGSNWKWFDEEYEYLTKLKPTELIVRIKEENKE